MSTISTQVSFADKETRQEAIKGFLDRQLEVLTERANDKEALSWWTGLLKTASGFWKYSFGNLCLITAQVANPSFVAGASAWLNTYGRIVKRGSKAVWILAPRIVSKKNKETGEKESQMIGFLNVPVFDYSQTEAVEGAESFKNPNELLRSTGDASKALPALEKFAAHRGYALTYVDSISGGARGVSTGKNIQVLSSLDPATKAKVLAHEIAHEEMHWKDGALALDHGKSVAEIEAESVAYVVCSALGIESNSELYLNAWGADREIVKKSTARIFKTTKEILTFIHEGAQ